MLIIICFLAIGIGIGISRDLPIPINPGIPKFIGIGIENPGFLVQEIIDVLEPAKYATEELLRKSNDLLIAEGTINFLLDELLLQGTLLSQKVYDMNCARIGARRNGTLIDLILYLNIFLQTSILNRQQKLQYINLALTY